MPGMRMRALPLAAAITVVALGAPGCVTKAKHDALQRELDDTEVALRAEQESERQAFNEQLQARDARVTDLEAALATAQEEADALGRQIASLQAMVAAKEAALCLLYTSRCV